MRAGSRPVLVAAGAAAFVCVLGASLALRPIGLVAGPAEGARSWLYLSAAAAAFAFYVAGLFLIRRRGAGIALVCAVAAAIQLAPLAGPLFLSRDAYSYWAYGRIEAIHGASPYATAPVAFPRDPATEAVAVNWRHETSVYGPVFSLVSAQLARVTGPSPRRAQLAFRALAAAAVLALVALAATRGAFAAAFVGWNPLLALQSAGGGHNDALMMALVATGIVLAARRRAQAGGVAWAAAVGVKWIAVALLPLHAIAERRLGRGAGLAGAATASIALVGLASAQYGSGWLSAFGPLAHQARVETSFSLAHRLDALGLSKGVAFVAVIAVLVGGYALLLRAAWRGRARLALAAGLLVLTTPWLLPWYAIWVVPLAALEEDRSARLLALVLCAYLLPARVPF